MTRSAARATKPVSTATNRVADLLPAQKPKAKTTKPQPAVVQDIKSPPVSSPPATVDVETRLIPIEHIEGDPGNPRGKIKREDILGLMESIRTMGLQQPLVVRPQGRRYQVVAGHRRLAACEALGIQSIQCRVGEYDDRQATLVQLVENLQREDLDPIAEALGYQQALDRLGCTQSDLAKSLSVTQGQISNRLRLLQLPDVWRKRLISGEISASQARDLVLPVADLPQVMKQVEEELKDRRGDDRELRDRLPEIVGDAADRHSKSLAGFGVFGCISRSYDVEVTPDLVQRFDVREVLTFDGTKEHRAFKVKEFGAYLQELYKPKSSKPKNDHSQKGTKNETAAGTGAKAKAANPMTDAQKKAAYNKRLYRWYIGWIQKKLLERLWDLNSEQVFVWLIGRMVTNGNDRFDTLANAIAKVTGQKKPSFVHEETKRWGVVLDIDRGKLNQIIVEVMTDWCQREARSWSHDSCPVAYEAFARELGIDIGHQFCITKDFLELHSTEQLLGLAQEWQIPAAEVQACKTKSALIDHLVPSRLQLAKCPNCLLQLKPCTLD